MVPPIRVWLYGTVGAYLCMLYTILNVLNVRFKRMDQHRYPRYYCYIMLTRLDDIYRLNWGMACTDTFTSLWVEFCVASQGRR